jgi:large subunit ribosomal protein L4
MIKFLITNNFIRIKKYMGVQKIVKYKSINLNKQLINNEYLLKLNILENSGNYLIHKLLINYKENLRQNTVSTKTRGEVQGGGKKPWRQKGTGKARAGSIRSPLWRGGGVIFGPKPNKKKLKSNKKERILALHTLLYNKRKNTLLIENLENKIRTPKTKHFLSICEKCNIDLNDKILVIVSEKTIPLKLSTKNLKKVELISAANLNIISLIKAKNILLTTLALNTIKEIYCE